VVGVSEISWVVGDPGCWGGCFFPASKPRLSRPTVSAPLMVWESMIPALGCGLRPCSARTCSRSMTSIRSVSRWVSHRTKYQYTVCQGGKSAGSCRHEQPVRTMYKIASTTARRGCFSRRPPRGAGNSGSTRAHCASVRSEGQRRTRATGPHWTPRPAGSRVQAERKPTSQTRSQ
jgi:hypothetical protein